MVCYTTQSENGDKIRALWNGPYVIIKALSSVTYRVGKCRNPNEWKAVHFDKLRNYTPREPTDLAWRHSKGWGICRASRWSPIASWGWRWRGGGGRWTGSRFRSRVNNWSYTWCLSCPGRITPGSKSSYVVFQLRLVFQSNFKVSSGRIAPGYKSSFNSISSSSSYSRAYTSLSQETIETCIRLWY